MPTREVLQELGEYEPAAEEVRRQQTLEERVPIAGGHVPRDAPHAALAPVLQFQKTDMMLMLMGVQTVLLLLILRRL